MNPEAMANTARKLAAAVLTAALVAAFGALVFVGWVLYTLVTWVVR